MQELGDHWLLLWMSISAAFSDGLSARSDINIVHGQLNTNPSRINVQTVHIISGLAQK